MFTLPERTTIVPLSLEQDSSGAVAHPSAPSTLQRDELWLLLVWIGVGSRAGGNSSGFDAGMLQLLPSSHNSWTNCCTQGRVSGVKVLGP